MSELTNTRITADPTDGRGVDRSFVPHEDNPFAMNDAISAMIKSYELAKRRGMEWTPADAYMHTRRFIKRRYR